FRVKTRFLSHVGKSPIAIIVVKDIVPPVGDQEVIKPVVVVIPDTYALSPSRFRQSGLLCYIGERSVTIVSEKAVSRSWRSCTLQGLAIHEKNVLPAVVVIVKEGCTTTGRFKDIFVLVAPTVYGRRRYAGAG